MQDFTLQALVASLLLGLGAYVLCLFLARLEPRIALERFLFSGNRPRDAAVSIVGTIFSGSVLFTGMIHFYRVYSWYLLPAYLMSAVLGMSLLAGRMRPILAGAEPSPGRRVALSQVRERFHRLAHQSGCRLTLYGLFLLYVLASLTTELSVFRGGLLAFGENALIPFATLVLVAITYAYVYLGGFRGVLLTDVFQMAMILISFGVLFTVLIGKLGIGRMVGHLPVAAQFSLPNLVCMCIAAILAGSAIWSSAPEVWIRVATLESHKDARTAIRWAFSGAVVVMLLPVLLVSYVAPKPAASIKLTEAFTVWSALFAGSPLLSIAFLVILVSAIFTTIDTFILTLEQLLWLLQQEYKIVEEALAGRLRKMTPVIIGLCFAAAMRLDEHVIFLIGALSLSVPIILCGLLHVGSRLPEAAHAPWVYWLPLIATAAVLPVTFRYIVEGRPLYYLVPLTAAGAQVLTLLVQAIRYRATRTE